MAPRAKQIHADLILASDPDADRMGVASRSADGSFVPLGGNRISMLLTDYILRSRRQAGSLSPEHFVTTTLVSTPMIETLAKSHGVRCFRDLLVGFKYIAGVVDQQGPERFVFGCEESLGYLAGTYARDKDATIAGLYLLELAAELKAQDKTLLDRLDELFREHGYFCDGQLSKTCTGESGREQIQRLTATLRSSPPAAIVLSAIAMQVLLADARAADTNASPVTANAQCPFNSKDKVEIAGIIQNLKTGHQEPQEQINSYFDLLTTGEPCGDGRIMVFAPGMIPCINGDRATLKGNYYPPDKDFFDIAMMDAWEVKCR